MCGRGGGVPEMASGREARGIGSDALAHKHKEGRGEVREREHAESAELRIEAARGAGPGGGRVSGAAAACQPLGLVEGGGAVIRIIRRGEGAGWVCAQSVR